MTWFTLVLGLVIAIGWYAERREKRRDAAEMAESNRLMRQALDKMK